MTAALGATLAAASLLLSACSLLIGSETSPLPCSQEGQLGPPACDAGFVCKAGLCQLATASGASGGDGGGGSAAAAGAGGGAGGAG